MQVALIDGALPAAGYVLLHVRLSPDGPVIGERGFALMRPSAILVNALRYGRLAAAAHLVFWLPNTEPQSPAADH
jgi:phosphoglycerate dehydrogenase-like enzyme